MFITMKPVSEVLNLDCLEYMKTLPDNHFDLCIADPPYGIKRSGQHKTICKNPKHNRKHFEDKGWDLNIPSEELFTEIFRISKNQVIWGLITLQNICLNLWVGLYGIKGNTVYQCLTVNWRLLHLKERCVSMC